MGIQRFVEEAEPKSVVALLPLIERRLGRHPLTQVELQKALCSPPTHTVRFLSRPATFSPLGKLIFFVAHKASQYRPNHMTSWESSASHIISMAAKDIDDHDSDLQPSPLWDVNTAQKFVMSTVCRNRSAELWTDSRTNALRVPS